MWDIVIFFEQLWQQGNRFKLWKYVERMHQIRDTRKVRHSNSSSMFLFIFSNCHVLINLLKLFPFREKAPLILPLGIVVQHEFQHNHRRAILCAWVLGISWRLVVYVRKIWTFYFHCYHQHLYRYHFFMSIHRGFQNAFEAYFLRVLFARSFCNELAQSQVHLYKTLIITSWTFCICDDKFC